MSKQPNGSADILEKSHARHPLVLITIDIADTAWRMFIPIIGATIIGLVIDKQLKTTPWIMIIFMICGIALAGLLVKRQLQRFKKEK